MSSLAIIMCCCTALIYLVGLVIVSLNAVSLRAVRTGAGIT